MQWPSFTFISMKLLLVYVVYSIYNMSLLFVVPACEEGKPCLTSYLSQKQRLQLRIYSSVYKYPTEQQIDFVYASENFNYTHTNSLPLTLNVPRKTRNNGTLFLHIIAAPMLPSRKYAQGITNIQKNPYVSYIPIKMTQYTIPEAEAFNLLGERNSNPKKKQNFVNPVTHIKSHVRFTIMTDDVKLPMHNVPVELVNHLKIIQARTFLPIMNYDILQTKHRLLKIMPQNNTVNITLQYSPISIGKLRLMLHLKTTMQNLKTFGFSDKDIDEVKGIFADTNMYILGGTFFIATIHLLFDFLAFKNDVYYWRKKDNLVGLSKWTIVWRGFSQTVIFLYLLEEGSSLFVLIPTGIGSIIEMWKFKKMLRLKLKNNNNNNNLAETRTKEFDAESMHYLSYLLCPLVIGGAIYSLLYQPHRSWYSWSINSLVNGVYAFGFLFMLPQLFVNYKLKSVAHLPWRTFMYKAFNTFIDDVFAFIISTPIMHRIACFRDDAIFLVYLYQRWLYPVDKSRPDVDVISKETVNSENSNKKTD